MRYILLLCFPFVLFAQDNKIITKEYYKSSKLRRMIKFDDNLNILSETYYRESNALSIATIEYKSKNEISRAIFFAKNGSDTTCLVDFSKGIYKDFISRTFLVFKNNFSFHGKQIGNNIISYYKNGSKDGMTLQYDSAIAGKVLSNKTVLLYDYIFKNGEAYIIGGQLKEIYKDTFRIYKGAYCNFTSGQLNGVSNVFYSSGEQKVKASFKLGLMQDYVSYDPNGAIISKMTLANLMTNQAAIINGTVQKIEKNNILWFYGLSCIGDMLVRYNPYEYGSSESALDVLDLEIPDYGTIRATIDQNTWNTGQLIQHKFNFDKNLEPAENIVVLRYLLGIPYFYINRYNFNYYDRNDFYIVRVDSNVVNNGGAFKPQFYTINEMANLKYNRNPFFYSDVYHTPNLKIFKDVDEFGRGRALTMYYKDRNISFYKWLEESHSYKLSGQNDFFTINPSFSKPYDEVNDNQEVQKFIKSYVSALVLNCQTLYKNRKITLSSFINPVYKTGIKFEGIGYNGNTFFELSTDDSIFNFGVRVLTHEINDEDKRVEFFMRDKQSMFEYLIIFSYDGSGGISDKIRDTEWTFIVRNEKNEVVYKSLFGETVLNKYSFTANDQLRSLFNAFTYD